jgi:hypothetical protein
MAWSVSARIWLTFSGQLVADVCVGGDEGTRRSSREQQMWLSNTGTIAGRHIALDSL